MPYIIRMMANFLPPVLVAQLICIATVATVISGCLIVSFLINYNLKYKHKKLDQHTYNH